MCSALSIHVKAVTAKPLSTKCCIEVKLNAEEDAESEKLKGKQMEGGRGSQTDIQTGE